MWDTGDAGFMTCVVVGIAGLIAVAIGMDMRRLPLGRIKWVPWSGLTVMLFFALVFAVSILLRDLTT
jgi:hypothetical protein